MDVSLYVLGAFEVDDSLDILDIDSSCSDLRGDHDLAILFLELVHDGRAFVLVFIPMQYQDLNCSGFVSRNKQILQILAKFFRLHSLVDEYQNLSFYQKMEDIPFQPLYFLLIFFHDYDFLFDILVGRRLVAYCYSDGTAYNVAHQHLH